MTEIYMLDEMERKNKLEYLANKDTTLFEPLSFKDYSKIMANMQEKHIDMRDFYRETSKNGEGKTIVRSPLFETTDIYVSKHPRYAYPILHNHDFIELIYVFDGQCINYIQGGNSLMMKAGDLCLMAPNTVHALLAVNDTDIIYNILLWPESFRSSFNQLMLRTDIIGKFFKDVESGTNDKAYLKYQTNREVEILQTVLEIVHEFEQKEKYYQEIIGYKINEILALLVRSYQNMVTFEEQKTINRQDQVHPIVNFIETNYQTVTLKELAQIFSYSETYLSRLIKNKTGQTFKELVERARFTEAKKLVLNSNLSMTEISQIVGYFDASHMSRDFVKKLGLPPKKWLQSKKIQK